MMKIPFDKLPGDMTIDQCDVIMSLVSIAENGTVKWWKNYKYCENIKDGRGMTVSLVGFCSGTGDLRWVFENLQKINPTHPLLKHLEALKVVRNGNTMGLESLHVDLERFGDKDWERAVWNGILKFYWEPAMSFANKICVKHPITKGFLFDIALNHGSKAIVEMCSKIKMTRLRDGGNEVEWLKELIDVRKHIIQKIDRSTIFGQPDRCLLWRSILDGGNLQLKRPLEKLKCYGSTFNIM